MITYQKERGLRLKSRFFDVTTFDGYWWVEDENRWVHENDPAWKGNCRSHFYGVRTIRAFRRRLKEWSKYLPSGVKFILVNRYVGYDAYGVTK